MKTLKLGILAIPLFFFASSCTTLSENNKLKSQSERYVDFLFGKSSVERVIQSVESFGAIAKGETNNRYWVYPSEDDPLFLIGYICTFTEKVNDLLPGAAGDLYILYNSFKPALGFDLNFSAVTMYVRVAEGSLAESNFLKFTLFMLDAHIGLVKEVNSSHAWTLEEIRNNSIRNGFRFFQNSETKK